jgi:hypothetical protein
METKVVSKKTNKRTRNVANFENKPKSKIALYWESSDRIDFRIADMRAVLK